MMPAAAPQAAAVTLRQLRKQFGADVLALEDVDLSIRREEFVSLIGPSGCGKTTLLRLMAGLEMPTGGEVTIGGRTPRQACAAHQVGVAFQKPALIPTRTALGNVELTLEISGHAEAYDPGRLLKRFGLGDFLHHYPHQLSGGMQQRVNIAAALVHHPALLLLDEPFGALDEMTRFGMVRWLSGVLRETRQTAVLVTHSVDEAVLLSDRVVVLSPRPGRIHRIVSIELPRPRPPADDPAVAEVIRAVRAVLHEVLPEEEGIL